MWQKVAAREGQGGRTAVGRGEERSLEEVAEGAAWEGFGFAPLRRRIVCW